MIINECVPSQEQVNLARKIEKIEFHNSREKQHNSWFRQAAEALEVDLDDDLLLGRTNITMYNILTFCFKVFRYKQLKMSCVSTGRAKDEDADREQQKMVKGMKKHLKHLISQPVFKNVIKTKYPTQMGKLSLPHLPVAGMESALTSITKLTKVQKSKKSVPPQGKKLKQKKGNQ